VASSNSALKITLDLASVIGLRVPEQVLRIWATLPVRGRVGVTLLGALALYGAWRAVVAFVLRPLALSRRHVVSTVDRTRTIDPALREPIDDEVAVPLSDAERALTALGFSAPQRTTTSTAFPIAAVGSLLEHPVHGDLATLTAARGGRVAAAPLAVACTFESQLADGTRLVSTTSDTPAPWPARKKTITTRLTPGATPAEAYSAHRTRVAAEATRSRQVPLTRGATSDQRLVFVKRETLHHHKHLVACGYLRRTADGLRLTYRGALALVRAGQA
jgi:hypothetical protein